MSNFNSLIRGVAAAAVFLASAALAQAPANDTCAGAEVMTVGSAPVTSSTATRLDLAAATVESTMSCSTSVKNSVWYQFTAPVSGPYRLETCGAATNYDTVLQVYSGTGCGALTQVTSGCNDTGSTCAPASASSVNLVLNAGTIYFVQVAVKTSVTLTTTLTHALTVTPPAPPPANDTCSTAEAIVPNGGSVVVSSPSRTSGAGAAAEDTFQCLSTPTNANSSVWYSITPSVTGAYRLESCAGTAPANTVSDTVLALYSGSCGTLTSMGCSDDSCASRSSITATLSAGTTYYLQLAKFGATRPSPTADVLQLSVVQIINSAPDLCSTAPTINLNETIAITTTAAPDGGYAIAQNNAQLDGGACFIGVGQTTTSVGTGRDVAYQFRAGNAGRYSFRVGTPSASVDALVYLTDSCVAVTGIDLASYGPPQCIAASNRNTAAQEQLSCVSIGANQTVYVWVDEVSASTSGSNLSLDVTACAAEVDPNDTPATASSLSCATTGTISPVGDVDFYALGAPPAGSRMFAMVEAAAANNGDLDLRLTTATGTIEYDDWNLSSSFGESAPLIAGAIAPGAPVFARVSYFNATTLADPYTVYSAVQTGAPIAEVEPNDNMASATTGSARYFTGTIVDGGSDVDVYSFNANAGDVVFAALDSVLDKLDGGSGTFNYAMTLIDSTDATILRVDDTSTNSISTGPINNNLTSTTPTFPGEGLVYRIRTTGTYGIRIDKTSGANTNPYLLSISVGCADLQPTLTSLTPVSGSPSGGQPVTLTGSNFNERSVVRFGSAIASVTSISPTQLVVLTPASSSGPTAVSVTNGVGLSSTLNPGFTFDDPPGLPPVITSITPTFGPVTGGTVVTLSGTVFRVDAGVFFEVGGTTVPAASVTVNNATRITATTPPHTAGVANVKVINYDALESTLPNSFTFEGPPTIANITPNTGLTTGGLTITITGTNFRAGTTVRIGGNLATNVVIAADGLSLTAVTPSVTTAGAVDVIVRTTDGQNTTSVAGFTYVLPAPLLTSITPSSGPAAGGTVITIVGANFIPDPTVTVGGAPATGVMRSSATQIVALTPPGTPGTADVVVTNSDNQSVTRTAGFRYVPAPTVSAISPANGPSQGGTRITLTGTNFVQGASVHLGGVPASQVTVTSATSATAVTRASAPGAVDVVVTNPDSQVGTLVAGYTYDGAPSMASLSPRSGSTAGGTVITIIGAGFVPNMTVSFGTLASPTVTRVSNTEITAVTPASPVGVVTVTATTPSGQSASLRDSFRFVTPPTVTAANPNTGDVSGGTVVRLTGTLFKAGTSVKFGGTAATQVSLVSDTELDAVTPRHAPGAVDIEVSTDGAIATLTGGFTYTRSAPTLAAVAPPSGPIAGGTLITLSGTGFAEGATITVGSAAATDVVIVSDVLARAVVPAHAAGAVDVVLTNDDMQAATLDNGFTYVAPPSNNAGTVTDGGSGAVGEDPPTGGGVPGGVSCGCSSFDGSMFSMAGFGLLMVLSRRRRRS